MVTFLMLFKLKISVMKRLFCLVLLSLITKYVSGLPDKLAGGTPVRKEQFPYFVQLLIGQVHRNEYISFNRCGGTLIHPKWVLTAAHCFRTYRMVSSDMFKKDFVRAYMGSEKIVYDIDNPEFTVEFVEEVIIHPNYTYHRINNSVSIANDVALASLVGGRPFLTKAVNIIKLPDVSPHLCSLGTIIGGGIVGFNFELEDIVKYAPAHSRKMDEVSIKPPFSGPHIFCTEIKWYLDHPLQGNSGGPFICSDNGNPVQYGIVSTYYNNTHAQTAITLYESVEEHMWFINKNVELHARRSGEKPLRLISSSVPKKCLLSSFVLMLLFIH